MSVRIVVVLLLALASSAAADPATKCAVWSSSARVDDVRDGRRLLGASIDEVTVQVSAVEELAGRVCRFATIEGLCDTDWETPSCAVAPGHASEPIDPDELANPAALDTEAAVVEKFVPGDRETCKPIAARVALMREVAKELAACPKQLADANDTLNAFCASAPWSPACKFERAQEPDEHRMFAHRWTMPAGDLRTLWGPPKDFGGVLHTDTHIAARDAVIERCKNLDATAYALRLPTVEKFTPQRLTTKMSRRQDAGTGHIYFGRHGAPPNGMVYTNFPLETYDLLFVVPMPNCGVRFGPVTISWTPQPNGERIATLVGKAPGHQETIDITETYADGDGDGVKDDDDQCKDVKGVARFKGCVDPDNDKDQIPDDECPEEAGPLATKGCPDRDGDEVADKDDRCPAVKGPAARGGCPSDRDADGVIDDDDACPAVSGLAALHGCPDGDNDGVADDDDACPTLAGKLKRDGFVGCPASCLPSNPIDKVPAGFECGDKVKIVGRSCACHRGWRPTRDGENNAICRPVPKECP